MDTIETYTAALVLHSLIETIKEGKIYSIVKKGKSIFIFDETGQRRKIEEQKVRLQALDPIVMIVRIKSSLLPTIQAEKIYRIFNDVKNNERYIIDANNEKVLFDKMIFNYEVL